ncbi:peroxidase-like [Paramacrobiotus metropolitanus]|uniref:peroxidase-like n=1 Tax=Paramacrobiotus metropolitanus TaxID=2943436 RepID=UPI00244652B3|nr:peroxidase-like [Paramacrobiotus metropolitanus]
MAILATSTMIHHKKFWYFFTVIICVQCFNNIVTAKDTFFDDNDDDDHDSFFGRSGNDDAFLSSPSPVFQPNTNLFSQPFFNQPFGQSFQNPFGSFSFKPSFSFSPAPAAATSFSSAGTNSMEAMTFPPFTPMGTMQFPSMPSPQPSGSGKKFGSKQLTTNAPVTGQNFPTFPTIEMPNSNVFSLSPSPPAKFSTFPAPAPMSISFPSVNWNTNTFNQNLQDQINEMFQKNAWVVPQNFVQNKMNEAAMKSNTQFGTFPSQGMTANSFPQLSFGSTGSMSNMFAGTQPGSLDIAKNAFTLEEFGKSVAKQLNFNKSTATVALPLVTVAPAPPSSEITAVQRPVPAPAGSFVFPSSRPPSTRPTTTFTETTEPSEAPQFQVFTTTTPQFVIVRKTTTTTPLPSSSKVPDCVVQEQPVIPLKDFLNPNVQPACARNKYRTHTGECNNIAFPSRGKESTVFIRLLAPDYADGISEPRKNSLNQPLPSARFVSSSLIGSTQHLAPTWTNMFMQFGQFLDHDLTQTPRAQLSADAPQCCGTANPHPQCLPITIPNNDPFYSQFGQTCMEFVRSLPGIRPGCRLGPREQINQLSAFIDGSQIYGTKDSTVNTIRLFSGGQLKSVTPFPNSPHYTVLPADPSNSACVDAANGRPCFKAGDDRCNVQLGLQTLHTVFMRHHNQLATTLQQLNPGWNDETLYQEARAIVAAQLQHITYTEWLPLLLGEEMMDRVGLRPQAFGRFSGYNISIHPGLINSFAAAAFRVGHAMVPSKFNRLNPDFSTKKSERVQDTFFKSAFLYEQNSVDEMVRGLATQQGKVIENTVVTDVSQQLFSTNPTGSFGLDLVAMNVQRGRDHGLPGYMKFRKLCGLPTASNFNDLKTLNILPEDMANRLASVYKSVDDIDLYIGGISEFHNGDAFIGPTFSCIISEQFWRLRVADRFWYEGNLPFAHTLSDAQLAEIRKISLSRILCNAVPGIQSIQPKVFLTVSNTNQRIPCDNIDDFSLQPWAGI